MLIGAFLATLRTMNFPKLSSIQEEIETSKPSSNVFLKMKIVRLVLKLGPYEVHSI